jgi:hypothetical protein
MIAEQPALSVREADKIIVTIHLIHKTLKRLLGFKKDIYYFLSYICFIFVK